MGVIGLVVNLKRWIRTLDLHVARFIFFLVLLVESRLQQHDRFWNVVVLRRGVGDVVLHNLIYGGLFY